LRDCDKSAGRPVGYTLRRMSQLPDSPAAIERDSAHTAVSVALSTSSEPLVSIIIPNWNGGRLIVDCLESLRRQRYVHLEVIVVDGASSDGSPELVAERFPEVRLLRLPTNRGFAGNVNAGLRAAGGPLLALLNNDAEADPDWISALVAALQAQATAGACASKILEFEQRGTIAAAGDLLHRDGLASQRGNGQPDDGRFDQPGEVFAASGGAVVYRRAMLEDVGLFDEAFFAYLEDVDLGLRARLRGWGCRYEPAARVYHRVSATGGGRLSSYFVARNSIRLIARCFPSWPLRACLPRIVAAQLWRSRSAAAAWRGEAARATLRGQLAGLANLPHALRSRRAIQARRTLSDQEFLDLLA
jgi:GT2 family glycosyltransferase